MNLRKVWRRLFGRDKTSGLLRPSIPVRESWESHGLTEVQKARLGEYVERYTRIALCTDEADWDTFETGARQCYKYAGLQQPKTFIRVQSPAVLALAAPIATAAIEVLREEWVRPGQEWNASLVNKQTEPPHPAHVRRALRSTIDSMGLANDPLVGRLRQAVKEAIDHAVGTATGSEAWASALCGESPLDYGDRRIQYKTEASALSAPERRAVTRAVDREVRDALDERRRMLPWVPEFNQAPVLGAASAVDRPVVSTMPFTGNKQAQARDLVRAASQADMYSSLDGQFQAFWHGYLAFLRDVCEFQINGDLWPLSKAFWQGYRGECKIQLNGDLWERERAYADAQDSVWRWWVHKDFVMVSNRPERIGLDAQGRLHCEDGMSIRFRDGFGLYHWHGVRVDERMVLRPQELTAKGALEEENAEVRRVMIERIGMERFLSETNATCIHRHKRGDLFSVKMPHGRSRSEADEPIRIVRVTDPSTGRIYFLRAPPSIKRADDAVAWTFGFKNRRQYQPIVET